MAWVLEIAKESDGELKSNSIYLNDTHRARVSRMKLVQTRHFVATAALREPSVCAI